MMNPDGLLKQALAFHQTGNLGDAERLYLQLMRAVPLDPTAPHLLGVVRAQQGRNSEALELMGKALKLRPNAPEVLSNYGNVLKTEGRFAEALASYDKALAAKPDYVATLAKRAMVLRDLGRLEAGLESVGRALAIQPDFVEALNTSGVILAELKRGDEALASYDRALALAPNFPDSLNNRALLLKELKRPEDALADVERALTVHGGFAEAWNNRGIILFDLKRMGDALDSYDRALDLRPNYAEAFNNRAVALWSLKRFAESLADCDRAVALRPGFADAHYNRGNALAELNRPEEAAAAYEQVLTLAPDHPSALSGLANAALTIGDWKRTAELAPRLKADVLAGKSVIQPFVLMGYHDDNELQLRCSQNYVRQAGPGPLPPLWTGERYGHDRIRVAYLSADFHQHVTAALTVEMFECHDRTRFETIAVSFGPDDNSAMRRRLLGAFDSFVDARQQNDREVAQMLREWEIDIAVDLGGHTSGARPWVLAHRPAPVQAKYMGFPGTSGSDFVDYIVTDRMVVPPDQDRFFSEKITALPTTLWVTDTKRDVPAPPSRVEAGLPESGFIFCCFNHNWKITPPLFDIWMRLLTDVDGSVLWLLEGNASIRDNLRRHAVARGVAPDRLIFAGRTTPEAHLARQQLADLFLDTLPYNAHTTASDALWAGLPLLTVPGRSFPARVAASILQAAQLPELIADNFGAYEAQALSLARDPAALKTIRDKLTATRTTMPLFDTARFTRELEAAYIAMLEAA
ncbi:MAG: tetratricopeptide repeat protein [Alphaproteobacteria bacterium]|nr:tetratricopeptide repeat protein [Alphaproteobacteria bacterium]